MSFVEIAVAAAAAAAAVEIERVPVNMHKIIFHTRFSNSIKEIWWYNRANNTEFMVDVR